MYEIIKILLFALVQSRIFHWQTKSYAEHKALEFFYDEIDNLLDFLVEAYSGKNERIILEQDLNIKAVNYSSTSRVIDFMNLIKSAIEKHRTSVDGSELQNIIDEIIAKIEKTTYLLTLK